ncbi:MAG: DUF1587 domain-containing protein, partial [Blastocatellia bacterium]
MKTRPLQLGLILIAGIVAIYYASASSQAQRANTVNLSAQRTLIAEHCVACHNQKSRTANVALEGLDFNRVGEHAEIWEKVLRKVRTGQMPPPKAPKPAASEVAAFVGWLEGALDRAAELNPNPGRPAVHRLNRAEYSNAIRDLLALDIKPGAALPVDDSGHGFDNIGEVLTLSPALLEKYLSVARRVSRLAVGDLTIKPSEERFRPLRHARGNRADDELPFYSRNGPSAPYYFPLDGEYLISLKTLSNPRANEPARFFEIRLPVRAGLRAVGVAFAREDAKPEAVTKPLDLLLDGASIKRVEIREATRLDALTISGPFNVTGRGKTLSRARIFVCRPTREKEEAACAKRILATLARRAFRRPVTQADLNPLLVFYERGRRAGDFDYGIQRALEALLVAP